MEETLSSEYEALNLLTSGVALQQLIEDQKQELLNKAEKIEALRKKHGVKIEEQKEEDEQPKAIAF